VYSAILTAALSIALSSAKAATAPSPGSFFHEGKFEENLTVGDAYQHTALHTLAPLALGVAAFQWKDTRPIGAALVGYGVLVGPSMGHFYLGQNPTGWNHLNQRASGLGLIGGGVLLGLIGMVESDGHSHLAGNSLMTLGALSAAAGASWLGHSVYKDIASLDHSHARYLAKAVDEPGFTLQPTVRPAGSATAYGAQITLRL
jgi:hypothetical protein